MATDWYHVTPTNDRQPHSTSGRDCSCCPRVDVENHLIVHNAWDNREFDEIAEEINSDGRR